MGSVIIQREVIDLSMSDSEDIEYLYIDDEESEDGSFEFSDDDFDDGDISLNDAEHDHNHAKIMFSFPTPTTSSGIPTHRMRYQTLKIDEIQKEIECKMKNLSSILQIDVDKCLILLLAYSWNEQKMLDDYISNPNQQNFLLDHGVTDKKFPKDLSRLLTKSTHTNKTCSICCCGPEPGEAMHFFSLYGCKHEFCTECYTHYIKTKNETSQILIDCPFSDPKCQLKMAINELKVISDFLDKPDKLDPLNEFRTSLQFISEDQIVEVYDLTSDNDDDEEDSDDDAFDSNGKLKRQKKEEETAATEEIIFDFHSTMQRKEIEEMDIKRNKTLLSKYWYNVCNQYCDTQSKKYRHCPHPDCDSVVECVGFDSNTVASIEEQISLLFVPLVRCGRKHQFCFNCMETSHAPCPCQVVAKWKQKCEDDSETLNWIQTNTKDCPKCKALIEKNGGCNHMTCTKCGYQFCWICMGDWLHHGVCNRYVASNKEENDGVRASLERYMFYFNQFNTQRISHDKDREILERFENKIRELQVRNGVSWIETVFYKESVSALLEGRQVLKWSYAFLFYVPKCQGKQLIEAAQWQLANKVEALSKLFADTPVSDVLSKKSSFLNIKSSMTTAREKMLETCIDIFADPATLKAFKTRLNIA